jgi:hypothetical protein
MLDAADRILVKGFQALIALDDRAVNAVGRVVSERVLPAVERVIKRDQR